ncbi:MAG: hypothetical protein K8I27_12990 [Planctomycetes bacterium]|nr:hypothetical protein [Planctomycetota bacterium]
MAVSPGKDYAVANKTTWVFATGVGDATGVITRQYLFIFPHNAIGGSGSRVSESTYTIGGRKPAEAIADLLANPATTPETLDDRLVEWSAQVTGPIMERLSAFPRVRIFKGFIRRSVVLSKKESGMDFGATSIRPKKEELPAFLEFFKDHEHLEIK